MKESCCCSAFLTAFGGVRILVFGHSRCVLLPFCCFNLRFPDDISWASLHMLIFQLYIFFVGCVFRSVDHSVIKLFVFLLSFKSSLYFWIAVLYMFFSRHFLLGCDLSSHFFWHCLSQDRYFHFELNSAYILFLSWLVPFMLYLKSHCYIQGHIGFLLCYLLGVFCFTFRSMILLFLATQLCVWDPCSPTKDWTHTLCIWSAGS